MDISSLILGFSGVIIALVGALVSRDLSKRTDELIRSEDKRVKELINKMDERNNKLIAEIQLQVADGQKRTEQILERMDKKLEIMELQIADGQRRTERVIEDMNNRHQELLGKILEKV